jgi:hypothetical protein
MISNLDFDLDGHTISGDITVISTGSARARLVGGSSGTITIMGDVIVQGGSFETQGTGSPTEVFVDHHGNVNVTGGTFAVSRGSQANGTGFTRWNMLDGDFSIVDATTRNSNPLNAWFVFDSGEEQTVTLTNVNFTNGGLPVVVEGGTTVDFGMSEMKEDGLFFLRDGATLATANEGGVDSTIQATLDTVYFDPNASYTFNGTTAQVTGVMMPDTVDGLTIDNEAGVVLSQETVINGVLRLVAGVFDNTIPFTLGPDGSISYEGGSLLYPLSIEDQLPEIPTEFALFQNYPNPFNPTTTIRYDIPENSHVTIKIFDVMGREVAELVNDAHVAGAYSVNWDARGYASGLYYYQISAGDFVSVRKLILMK